MPRRQSLHCAASLGLALPVEGVLTFLAPLRCRVAAPQCDSLRSSHLISRRACSHSSLLTDMLKSSCRHVDARDTHFGTTVAKRHGRGFRVVTSDGCTVADPCASQRLWTEHSTVCCLAQGSRCRRHCPVRDGPCLGVAQGRDSSRARIVGPIEVTRSESAGN